MSRRSANEYRAGIQANIPVGPGGAHLPEPGLHRLDEIDEGRQGPLAFMWRVLKADLAAFAGVLFGVPLGAFFGGLLGVLVGDSFAMLRWGILGSWIGGVACALVFAILAWKDPH